MSYSKTPKPLDESSRIWYDSHEQRDQKVRPKAGGKGNQVEVLNDPVTVSGSDILGGHCRKMVRKAAALVRRRDRAGNVSQETCFLRRGELPRKADPDRSRAGAYVRGLL